MFEFDCSRAAILTTKIFVTKKKLENDNERGFELWPCTNYEKQIGEVETDILFNKQTFICVLYLYWL